MKLPQKPILLIILDLFSTEEESWIDLYFEELEAFYDIYIYTPRFLEGIANDKQNKEQIHNEFVNGAIEKAVDKLIEMFQDNINVLGFSIGGTIAWKANLKGLKVDRLICVSATRLRNETEKPLSKIDLYYGKDDNYQPDSTWFKTLSIKAHIIENQGHEIYKEDMFSIFLSDQIITSQ